MNIIKASLIVFFLSSLFICADDDYQELSATPTLQTTTDDFQNVYKGSNEVKYRPGTTSAIRVYSGVCYKNNGTSRTYYYYEDMYISNGNIYANVWTPINSYSDARTAVSASNYSYFNIALLMEVAEYSDYDNDGDGDIDMVEILGGGDLNDETIVPIYYYLNSDLQIKSTWLDGNELLVTSLEDGNTIVYENFADIPDTLKELFKTINTDGDTLSDYAECLYGTSIMDGTEMPAVPVIQWEGDDGGIFYTTSDGQLVYKNENQFITDCTDMQTVADSVSEALCLIDSDVDGDNDWDELCWGSNPNDANSTIDQSFRNTIENAGYTAYAATSEPVNDATYGLDQDVYDALTSAGYSSDAIASIAQNYAFSASNNGSGSGDDGSGNNGSGDDSSGDDSSGDDGSGDDGSGDDGSGDDGSGDDGSGDDGSGDDGSGDDSGDDDDSEDDDSEDNDESELDTDLTSAQSRIKTCITNLGISVPGMSITSDNSTFTIKLPVSNTIDFDSPVWEEYTINFSGSDTWDSEIITTIKSTIRIIALFAFSLYFIRACSKLLWSM